MNKIEITYKKVSDLIPYARNTRTHSEEQITQIASSIKEFGFTNAILLDGDNGLIAGHGRLIAAKKLGMNEVPTVDLSHLSEAQKKAYIIADNSIALNSGWDMDLLKLEIEELEDMDFDMDLLAFDDEFLEDALNDVEEVGLPDLADGDKEPFQQKTFTLHDEQASIVDDAIMLARTSPIVDTGLNDNSNGNAMALICREWLDGKG